MVHSAIVTVSTVSFLLTVPTTLFALQPNIAWNSVKQEPPLELKDIVPPVIFAELAKIHRNESLTISQKIVKIDEIISALPENILQRFPLPPVFRLFPEDVQELFKAIRTAKNLTAEEKWLHMAIIIESLPEEQKQILHKTMPDFPPALSPDLQNVIPKEAWEQLVLVYQNANLDKTEKMRKIDEVVGALPDSTRQKLPSLSPFHKLPEITQHQLQAVHKQHGLSAEQRFQKITSIIQSLPLNTKKLILPHSAPSLLPPPISSPFSLSSLPSVKKSKLKLLN